MKSQRLSRAAQFIVLLVGIIGVVAGTLVIVVAWGPKHDCALVFPKMIGCAIGSYEGLSGGLIAAAGALVAGWLAYSAAAEQIFFEREQAAAFQRRDLEGRLSGEVYELERLNIAQATMKAFEARFKINDGVAPNASCLAALWRGQVFPSSSRDLDTTALRGLPYEAVTRLRNLGGQIVGETQGVSAEIRPALLERFEANAADAVNNFRDVLAQFDDAISQQKAKVETTQQRFVAASKN